MTTPSGRPDPGVADALRLLGLARRAGHVEAGASAVKDAVRSGRARLVLVADDAAPGQAAKVLRLGEARAVPLHRPASRAALGAALGQPPLTAVAITEQGLAEEVLRRLGVAGTTGRPDADRKRSD